MEVKTFTIHLGGEKLNDFIIGRISGLIDAFTGMPNKGYAMWSFGRGQKIRFDATEDQLNMIEDAISKCYFGVIDWTITE